MWQVTVLTWVIYESSFPTCNTHVACRPGEYCYHNYANWSKTSKESMWRQPRWALQRLL